MSFQLEEARHISLKIEKELHMGKIPASILRAKRHDFTLAVTNEDGTSRTINNSLTSLALPVENVSNSTNVGNSSKPAPYESISLSLLKNNKEVSITTLDVKTNKTQTFNNRETLQAVKNGENVVIQAAGETEGECFQNEVFQGINPNSNSVRFDPQPTGSSSFMTTFFFVVQLVIVYSFITPLLNNLQSLFQKKVLNKFFKKDPKEDLDSDEE